MGKKRVVTGSGTKGEEKFKQIIAKKVKGKKISQGRLYIRASYNNTILTLTDSTGNVISWTSAGMLGFTGPKRSTPYAAIQAARALVQRAENVGLRDLEVYVNGIGSGPEAAIRALASEGLNVTFIKNVTPIPHGGPRPKKPRKV